MFPESPKPKHQKPRVKVTFQLVHDTPNGEVLLWLLHKEGRNLSRDKFLEAARAFWLPLARRDALCYSPLELQEAAQVAIWRLEEQIKYLRSIFGLEVNTTTSLSHELSTSLEAVLRKLSLVPLSHEPNEMEASGEALDLQSLQKFDWSFDESELGEASA